MVKILLFLPEEEDKSRGRVENGIQKRERERERLNYKFKSQCFHYF